VKPWHLGHHNEDNTSMERGVVAFHGLDDAAAHIDHDVWHVASLMAIKKPRKKSKCQS
jgi:hypothetical protein